MEANKILAAFQAWWLKKSVPDSFNGTQEKYTPSSLALNDRKGAARLAFEAGYKLAKEHNESLINKR